MKANISDRTHFFDTYALIEIIKGNQGYKRFIDEPLITGSLNLGELYYHLTREFGKDVSDFWKDKLTEFVLEVDSRTITKGMIFKLKNRKKNLSFVDCVTYMQALQNGFLFVTGDMEFEDISDVVYIK